METDVVDKIEEGVNTISGIDTLSSTSYEGLAIIAVSFNLEKADRCGYPGSPRQGQRGHSELPLDTKTPIVDKVDPDASPILQLALSSPGNIRDTSEYADKVLRRQIESINGVGQVLLIGARKRQINVILDPSRLKAYDLTSVDVQNALASQNIQVPGGTVDQKTRELTLRTKGRLESPGAFDDLVIKKQGPNPIRIRDVGTTEDGVEEPETSAILSGNPTVLLSIRKQSGLNTVATVDAILDKLKDINKALPSGYSIRVVRDQSEFIRASADAVKEHLVIGSILAALVVLVFLWNWRTTVISALAIPASIISTFAAMYMLGFTLNSLTLLGLTLSVGIVIDDAIVVLENIYRFIEEKGMNPFEAAIEGTREIGLAVLATTLSLIAVFLPVAFMSGIVGRFLNSFGMTMAFAIAVSLLVSFTLTPMLASRWIKPKVADPNAAETSDAMPVGEAPGAGKGTGHKGSKEIGAFPPHRCHLYGASALLHATPLDHRVGLTGRTLEHRAARRGRAQELPAGGRSGPVPDHGARARRHQSADDRGACRPHRCRHGETAGCGLYRRHHRRQHAADPQPCQHLREAEAGGAAHRSQPFASRPHDRCAPEGAAAVRLAAHQRRANSGVLDGRPQRDGHLLPERSGPRQTDRVLDQDPDGVQEGARRRGCRLVANRRQA